MVLLPLSYASLLLLLLFLFFLCFLFCFSRCRAASITGRTVAAVVGGAASNGEERERLEREITILLLSSVICFFCPLYSVMVGEEGDAEGGKGEWLSCCVVLAEN